MTIETSLPTTNLSPETPTLSPRSLCILHFNDCYNVEPQIQEPVGGAARFVAALRTFEHLDPLVLFSGDIIAPSIMSTFTKGEQMLPVLDKCRVDCALFGNHEFDFGLDYLIDFAKRTNIPWLMSNTFCKKSKRPLGEARLTHIIERNGLRVGLMGLIEEEWLSTLVLDPEDIDYYDFIEVGRRLALQLREEEAVDVVIALTHMRTHNDIKLAEAVPEIDLILGGHDHVYDVRKVNGRFIIKSGTDFRQFSKIDVRLPSAPNDSLDIAIKEVNVTSKFGEDPWLAKELQRYETEIEGQMENVIAQLECDLDGRFASVRSAETNLGNLFADVMLDASVDGDFALLNSGTLRSDKIHPAGDFKRRDLLNILPYMESMILLEITGDQVHQTLENGVCQYPKLEGRFPQISGIRFAFCPKKPPGQRVIFDSITIGDEALDRDRKYRMVTKEFIAMGRDGYDVLKGCPVYKSPEHCLPMIQAVTDYFEALRLMQLREDLLQARVLEEDGIGQASSGRRQSLIGLSRKLSKQIDAQQVAQRTQVPRLCPKIDGRIKVIL